MCAGLHEVCNRYRSISCCNKYMKNVKFTCGAGWDLANQRCQGKLQKNRVSVTPNT